MRLRLSDRRPARRRDLWSRDFDEASSTARQREADEFYDDGHPRRALTATTRAVMRQALARPALVEAVLSLRRHGLAGRRSRPAGAAGERAARAGTASGRTCTTPT